jgi:hypothetical protein
LAVRISSGRTGLSRTEGPDWGNPRQIWACITPGSTWGERGRIAVRPDTISRSTILESSASSLALAASSVFFGPLQDRFYRALRFQWAQPQKRVDARETVIRQNAFRV